MNFYHANLAVLVVANTCSLVYRHRSQNHKLCRRGIQRGDNEATAAKFQQQFLLVYALVVAADWLQVCKKIHSFKMLS